MATFDISIDPLNISVGGKNLVIDSKLVISHHECYGVVGKNGCGKTSLLHYLESLDHEIDRFLVTQELIVTDDSLTVYQLVMNANRHKQELLRTCARIEEQLETNTEAFDEYQRIIEELNSLDINKDESIIRSILHGLGFSRDQQDKPLACFSGGWRMRAHLACGLYMKPSLLLLDEPTNHLDLESTFYLIHLLNEYPHTVVLVSHDQTFLNSVVSQIIHLSQKKLVYYHGDYDYFEKMFKQNYSIKMAQWRKYNSQLTKLKRAGKSTTSIKVVEQPEPIYKPRLPRAPETSFRTSVLLSLEHVSFSYSSDRPILENMSLDIGVQSRISLVGANGSGKTTLINIVVGLLQPIKGTRNVHSSCRIGYYAQHLTDELPGHLHAVQYLYDTTPLKKEQDIRQILGIMGLLSHHHLVPMSSLSGGQRARVLLGSVLSQHPNVLILDEPTNHLDLETIETLMTYVKDFPGAVVMATHHLRFMSECSTRIYEIDNHQLVETSVDEYEKKVLDSIQVL